MTEFVVFQRFSAQTRCFQLSLFPEQLCSAFLVATNSPKKAFYKIWIEANAGIFTVRKESGIKNRILDRRSWPFEDLARAIKLYEHRVEQKLDPERKSPRKYRLVSKS